MAASGLRLAGGPQGVAGLAVRDVSHRAGVDQVHIGRLVGAYDLESGTDEV